MTREEKILGGLSIGGILLYLLVRPREVGPTPEGAGLGGDGAQRTPSPSRTPSPPTRTATEHPVVCQRWLTGNARKSWGVDEWDLISKTAGDVMSTVPTQGVGLAALKQRAFVATKETIAALCPSVPLPTTSAQVVEYKADPELGFWWDALWDGIYQHVWGRVVAEAGGSL